MIDFGRYCILPTAEWLRQRGFHGLQLASGREVYRNMGDDSWVPVDLVGQVYAIGEDSPRSYIIDYAGSWHKIMKEHAPLITLNDRNNIAKRTA
jgi:hypothetical protein